MFGLSPSELRVRIILAFGFLLLGLVYTNGKGAGLPNTGTAASNKPAMSIQLALEKEKSSAISATNPQYFKIAAGQLQIVEFYYPGEPASENTAQLMHTFENRYRGQVIFSYLDVKDPRNETNLEQLHDLFYPQFAILDASGHILDEWITTSDDKMGSAIANARLVEPLW